MNRLLGIMILAAGLAACQKSEILQYNLKTPASIYFNFLDSTSMADSVVYTFAFTPGKLVDTVYIPVRISGAVTDRDRVFGMTAMDSGTTAILKIHYAPLQNSYTIPAGQGTAFVPVIVYNTDSLLAKRAVSLELRLAPTSDLDTSVNDLIRARVIISNKLEEPSWWTMWEGAYFSSVKYQLFIIATGVNTLSTVGTDAPKNQYFANLCLSLLQDPFTWVDNHPGYVMELQPDGSYKFYNTENPSGWILYAKNKFGNWFFRDENGGDVQ